MKFSFHINIMSVMLCTIFFGSQALGLSQVVRPSVKQSEICMGSPVNAKPIYKSWVNDSRCGSEYAVYGTRRDMRCPGSVKARDYWTDWSSNNQCKIGETRLDVERRHFPPHRGEPGIGPEYRAHCRTAEFPQTCSLQLPEFIDSYRTCTVERSDNIENYPSCAFVLDLVGINNLIHKGDSGKPLSQDARDSIRHLMNGKSRFYFTTQSEENLACHIIGLSSKRSLASYAISAKALYKELYQIDFVADGWLCDGREAPDGDLTNLDTYANLKDNNCVAEGRTEAMCEAALGYWSARQDLLKIQEQITLILGDWVLSKADAADRNLIMELGKEVDDVLEAKFFSYKHPY